MINLVIFMASVVHAAHASLMKWDDILLHFLTQINWGVDMVLSIASIHIFTQDFQEIASLSAELKSWFKENDTTIILSILLAVIVYIALGFFIRWAAHSVRNGQKLTGYRRIFSRAVTRTKHIFRLALSLMIIALIGNFPPAFYAFVRLAFTIIATFQVALWLRELIIGIIEQRSTRDGKDNATLESAKSLIRALVSVGLFSIATMMVLDNLGVDITGIVAGLGIGGIAIGLAAQGIFSDLFAALSIIFDKPFIVGDTIKFGSNIGTIEDIGMKSIRIRSVTGEEIIISNSKLLDHELTNYSHLNRRRIRFDIGLIYQTDPAKGQALPRLLAQIVEQYNGRFVRCGFVGYGESSINFVMEFDILSGDYEEVFTLRHQIGLAVLERLNAEGYEFAYPSQTQFLADPNGRLVGARSGD